MTRDDLIPALLAKAWHAALIEAEQIALREAKKGAK